MHSTFLFTLKAFIYNPLNRLKMEKIFDVEFRETLLSSLKEAGIDEEKASSIVNKRYETALKKAVLRKAVVNRLKYIATLIEEDKCEEVLRFISYSPSGDCMGCDNHYLNFSDISDRTDIGDVLMGLDSSVELPGLY